MLGVVEHDSRVETREGVPVPHPEYLHVETDFAFGGFLANNANRHIVHWREDPGYSTQVNYERKTPCLLVVEPTNGPDQTIGPKESFTSVRAFELLYDSSDRDGAALRCGNGTGQSLRGSPKIRSRSHASRESGGGKASHR